MTKNSWKEAGRSRRAGVLVPLFSVYSGSSAGIGDFSDLSLLAGWCEASGSSMLQLLPMNEFGSTCCPYDAISSFAIEPCYIAIHMIPRASDKAFAPVIFELRKKFPAGAPKVDYRIKAAKLEALRRIYQLSIKEDRGELDKFCAANGYWLDDFALYKSLKERNSGKPWYDWDGPYRDRESAAMSSFSNSNAEEITFQKWVQWVAASQFIAAKKAASGKGILVKGDLPILISRDSADVWAHRDLFKLDFAAGAPPDMYCAKGQRWGVPTYDWDRIAAQEYIYLKEKLKYAENFYDIIRIDHVVGLFRIWSIPYGEPAENAGLNGSFDPPDENVWQDHGRALLSKMIESTDMLLCAEDLGMIPRACPETLKELEIPGNEVQRWVKDWSVTHDFLDPKDYRKCAVAMLSTHDTTNWPAWWENEAGTVDEELFIRKCKDRNIDYQAVKAGLFDPSLSRHGRLRWRTIISSAEVLVNILGKRREEVKDFIEMYENTYMEKEKLWKRMGLKGPMRETCGKGVIDAALEITLRSSSVFCINLINDYLFLDDIFDGDPYAFRVNRPGTVGKSNWSMTIPLPLEKLIKHKVTKKIRAMVSASGRS